MGPRPWKGSRWPQKAQEVRKMAPTPLQEAPKTAPKRSQGTLKTAYEGLGKTAQEASKILQERSPRRPPRRPETPQDAPIGPIVALQMASISIELAAQSIVTYKDNIAHDGFP